MYVEAELSSFPKEEILGEEENLVYYSIVYNSV